MKTFGRPDLCIYEYIKRLCKELHKEKPSKCPYKCIESCFYRPFIVIKFLSHWTSVTAIYYALACWQLVDRSKKQPRCEIRAKSQGGREGESRTKDKLRGLNSIHLYSLLCSPNKLFFSCPGQLNK